MRVTGNMVSDAIIQNLNIDLSRLQDINQQIATGRRINKPSDDPLGAQRVVNLDEALAGIDQYKRNANTVTNWVHASESTLNGVNEALKRANTLAIRGANDSTLTPAELATIGDEVNRILESVVASANTTLEGKYIFGGYQTQAPPFQAAKTGNEITAVTYAGDSGVDQVEIDTGLVVNKNVPGGDIFQPAAGTDVFAALISLRDALRNNDHAGVTAGIDATSRAQQQVVHQVSVLGNKTNSLEMVTDNLNEKKIGLTKLSSELGDTDITDAVVRLQTAQNVYDAALASSSRILGQSNLMDFLK